MYILIDLNQYAITHKHIDHNVLNLLGWIECENAFRVVKIGDSRALRELDTMIIARIYKNATGGEMNPWSTRLDHALFSAAKRMPETDAKLEELESQARYVKDGDGPVFQYRKGAEMPDRYKKSYTPPPLRVARVEEDEKYSFTPTVTPQQQREEAAVRGTVPADQSTPWKAAPKPPVAPAVPGSAPWTRPKADMAIAPQAPGAAKRPWEK